MSRRYVLSPYAQDDRDGIFDYTARRSGDVEVAFRVDEKIEEILDDIAANPTIGHTRVDLGIPEYLLVRGVYSSSNSRDPQVTQLEASPNAERSPMTGTDCLRFRLDEAQTRLSFGTPLGSQLTR